MCAFSGQRSKPSANNCTIPSRYQTIVYENTEKKGFTTKAPRFDDYLNVVSKLCVNKSLAVLSTRIEWRGGPTANVFDDRMKIRVLARTECRKKR